MKKGNEITPLQAILVYLLSVPCTVIVGIAFFLLLTLAF